MIALPLALAGVILAATVFGIVGKYSARRGVTFGVGTSEAFEACAIAWLAVDASDCVN